MNRPLFTASKLMGLLPINLHQYTSSYTDYLLVITIPLVYCGCYIGLYIYDSAIPKNTDCKIICDVVNYYYLYIGIIVYVMVLIRILTKKEFFLKFHRVMSDIDEEIQKCKEELILPRKNNFQVIFLSVGCALFTIGAIYDTYTILITSSAGSILASFCSLFPFLIGCLSQAQFIGVVHEIAIRFDDLNNILENISEESDSRSGQLKIFDIESDLKEKSTSEKKLIDDENNSRKDTEKHLVDVFKLHDKLCSASVFTNSEYAVEIVTYMTSIFILNIFGIFMETKVIFIVGGRVKYLDFLATSYIIWGVIFLLVAYMILRLCCRVMHEEKRSALLVHEIMQKKPAFMLGNDVYYNRMKGFTLQFLHWENYFFFNGIGLFPLDYTFIFSAISAATSYLIVLLQFDIEKVM